MRTERRQTDARRAARDEPASAHHGRRPFRLPARPDAQREETPAGAPQPDPGAAGAVMRPSAAVEDRGRSTSSAIADAVERAARIAASQGSAEVAASVQLPGGEPAAVRVRLENGAVDVTIVAPTAFAAAMEGRLPALVARLVARGLRVRRCRLATSRRHGGRP